MKDAVIESLETIKSGISGVVQKQDQIEIRLKDLETKTRTRNIGMSGSLPGVELEKTKFSFSKAMFGLVTGDWRNAGLEKEIGDQMRKKAMDTATSGSGGGYVVPQEVLAQDFIPLLRANAVTIGLGARLLEGLTGSPVRIPKQTASGTIYWVGQNATLTAADAAFGEVQMTPKTMAMRTQYSNLLNILSNPSMEELIKTDFAQVCALEMDRVVLRGTGSSNQPLGLANTAGIGTLALGTNGANFDFSGATDALGVLEDANALKGKVGFVFHGKVKRMLKKTRIPQFSGDTGGAYIVPPILSDRMLTEMLGYNFGVTTQLPINLTKGSGTNLSEVYVANWEEVLIGQWGGLEILATNVGGNAWAQNAIEVRLILNMDVAVRHPESVCYINDAKTA